MWDYKSAIQKRWYAGNPGWLLVLTPLSMAFIFISLIRKFILTKYRHEQHTTPICVVGNISVGGTGKTPIIICLIERLQQEGLRVGVVSRGYGATLSNSSVTLVSANHTPQEVGDEPFLIYSRTRCAVAISADRNQACETLVQQASIDLILSDDGLQHYAMARPIELAVMDAKRLVGNGHRIPVGPLRESPRRLRDVKAILINGAASHELDLLVSRFELAKPFHFSLEPKCLVNLATSESLPVSHINQLENLAAIAGIGNPQRFFDTLQAHISKDGSVNKSNLRTKVFDDHHFFTKDDLLEFEPCSIIMTEKDAVKCKPFAQPNMWFLTVDAKLEEAFLVEFIRNVDSLINP